VKPGVIFTGIFKLLPSLVGWCEFPEKQHQCRFGSVSNFLLMVHKIESLFFAPEVPFVLHAFDNVFLFLFGSANHLSSAHAKGKKRSYNNIGKKIPELALLVFKSDMCII
jgi:hypothetical protein